MLEKAQTGYLEKKKNKDVGTRQMMWCKHDYVARDKKIIQQPLKSQRKCIKTLISHRRNIKYLWILAHSIS
jgi:predicted glycosyltransferase involved in capsule biosynthesis